MWISRKKERKKITSSVIELFIVYVWNIHEIFTTNLPKNKVA